MSLPVDPQGKNPGGEKRNRIAKFDLDFDDQFDISSSNQDM